MGNPRRTNSHRRNQARARVLAEETHCWAPFCKQWVNKELPPRLPDSPEVHEIIPVSRGGSPYDRANMTLTHRRCNQTIGNKTPSELAANEQSNTVSTLTSW